MTDKSSQSTVLARKARSALRLAGKPILDRIKRARLSGLYTDVHNNTDVDLHIREGLGWLVRAQDAGNDRGVSYGAKFDQEFEASYPETTGYIIPTFLALAKFYSDDKYRSRAIEMGDWEISIQ